MCHLSSRFARTKGAVLLYTLLLLMVVAGLVLSIVSAGLKSAVEVDSLQAAMELEGKLESAVDVVVQDILLKGGRSSWLNPPANRQRVTVDGTLVLAEVHDARGLLDLNMADRGLLARLFAVLPQSGTERGALLKLDASRMERRVAWGSYSEVARDLGVSVQTIICIQPYVTLFSGRRIPSWHYAPEHVRDVLRLPAENEVKSALSEERSPLGYTYKIVLSAATEQMRTADLVVELVITGNSRNPYITRSWFFLPRSDPVQCARG